MILIAFRRGLRVSELVGLRVGHFDSGRQTLKVNRRKGSRSGTHELSRLEVEALRRVVRENRDKDPHAWLFQSERGGGGRRGGLTTSAFFKLLRRAGLKCDPPIAVHPHMLRHGCGFHMINEGCTTRQVQEHLGHRSITVTERYTELVPQRDRKRVWDD